MTFAREFAGYVGQFRDFKKGDWVYYVCWIGMMVGLIASVGGFIAIGALNGVRYPAYVWNVPLGIAIFVVAIAIDTIGHRTRYKARLDKGEGFVHSITIGLGVTSVVLLCAAYSHPGFLRIPAFVFMGMSFFYSFVDEWMHWKRYVEEESDRVEMWSHVFIFIGHFIMMLSWWHWFDQGYPGVAETLALF